MDIVALLNTKKVRLKEIPKWEVYLRKQWENNFAGHLTADDKKAIYLSSGYLWHLFSYNKRECLVGEPAEKAFNLEPKSFCFLFWQHSKYAFILENASMLVADALRDEKDIYIVDKDFTWTYVVTHESELGPYFCRR